MRRSTFRKVLPPRERDPRTAADGICRSGSIWANLSRGSASQLRDVSDRTAKAKATRCRVHGGRWKMPRAFVLPDAKSPILMFVPRRDHPQRDVHSELRNADATCTN